MFSRLAAAAALALILPSAVLAQPPTPPQGTRPQGGPPPGQGAPPSAPGKPKPYADVITKEAKSDLTGLFKTHQIDDKYYFEIPKSALGKEVMWVTTLERSSAFYGFGQTEVQDRVVRFEKRGDKVLMRGVSYRIRANENHGDVKRALEKGNIEPILAIYTVLSYGDGESMVIDASPLIYSSLFGASFDPSRSFIESMKSFPQNVLVKVTGTRAGGGAPPSPFGGGAPAGGASETVVINHNIVMLPEKPMLPRLFDSRVGWFATSYQELGGSENKVKDVTIIDRWRLEKKDPSAALSEPVKPITYYMGSEIPAKWKPFIKKGIEAWNPAFEKAGFKNAVVCRDIPSKEEDPEFDDEDIRYTMVRWLPSGVENAYGPHLSDPRTGEILNGSPKIFHNILSLVQNWYFVQASHSDPRARKLPFPEDLTGELLAYVVTHEVGHTLGFPHNMKASSSVPIANLRDPKWTAQWGTTPSIMDYARNNYVAQPEDKVTQLMPKIGMYDHFAVEWGYSVFPGVKTSEDEKTYLNAIANRQMTNPMLRFGNPSGDDPGRQTEDIGADGVEATRLGMKNLERTLGWLASATLKSNEDFSDLDAMYNEVLGQRSLELGHVLTIVGGVTETEYHVGQSGNPNYTPVPKARQKAAVQLFNDLVFKTSPILVRPDITSKTSATGTVDRVLSEQRRFISGLLSDSRLNKLVEFETTAPKAAYPISELLTDLKNGIFSELAQPKPTTDLYRRNLQRAYVDALVAKLGPPPAPPTLPAGLPADLVRRARSNSGPLSGEAKVQVRAALGELQASLATAKAKTTDRATLLHITDSWKLIDEVLNPKK
ncbi:MAG: zinc-dependent metalloprotease [Armatimonadetes bacterium]|nr:zinc-dependent metalloprotease [Armatimonadota bacterium]